MLLSYCNSTKKVISLAGFNTICLSIIRCKDLLFDHSVYSFTSKRCPAVHMLRWWVVIRFLVRYLPALCFRYYRLQLCLQFRRSLFIAVKLNALSWSRLKLAETDKTYCTTLALLAQLCTNLSRAFEKNFQESGVFKGVSFPLRLYSIFPRKKTQKIKSSWVRVNAYPDRKNSCLSFSNEVKKVR